MKHLITLIAVFLYPVISFADSNRDTVHLFFKLNEEKIYKQEQAKLDSLLYNDIINNGTAVMIIGYADYLGSEEHNMGLSERRARAIQQYLVTMQMPASNIKLCIGKGEVDRMNKNAEGYAPDRRVDVVINAMNKKLPVQKLKKSNIRIGELSSTEKSIDALAGMKKGQVLRLENIYFVLGRHLLTNESYVQVDKLYETLADNPTLKIQIEGHICCLKYGFDAEDDDTHEITLSLNRARYIYEYLIKKGIDKNRLSYTGFGRTRPLVRPERSPKDEDMNRRVEIRVIEN